MATTYLIRNEANGQCAAIAFETERAAEMYIGKGTLDAWPGWYVAWVSVFSETDVTELLDHIAINK